MLRLHREDRFALLTVSLSMTELNLVIPSRARNLLFVGSVGDVSQQQVPQRLIAVSE
jgi:hypothetical protein